MNFQGLGLIQAKSEFTNVTVNVLARELVIHFQKRQFFLQLMKKCSMLSGENRNTNV